MSRRASEPSQALTTVLRRFQRLYRSGELQNTINSAKRQLLDLAEYGVEVTLGPEDSKRSDAYLETIQSIQDILTGPTDCPIYALLKAVLKPRGDFDEIGKLALIFLFVRMVSEWFKFDYEIWRFTPATGAVRRVRSELSISGVSDQFIQEIQQTGDWFEAATSASQKTRLQFRIAEEIFDNIDRFEDNEDTGECCWVVGPLTDLITSSFYDLVEQEQELSPATNERPKLEYKDFRAKLTRTDPSSGSVSVVTRRLDRT